MHSSKHLSDTNMRAWSDKGICIFLLGLLVSLAVVIRAEEDVSICPGGDLIVCENDNECRSVPPVTCHHGDCNRHGSCDCYPCWSGTSCNISANQHPPKASYSSVLEVSLPADQPPDEVFLNIEIEDHDFDERCRYMICPCVDTHFKIRGEITENARDLFGVRMMAGKGALFLTESGALEEGDTIELDLVLSNTDNLQYSEAVVTVSVSPPLGYDDDGTEGVVERRRRAVITPEEIDLNDTVQFSLDVHGPSPGNITNVTIGTHVDLEVTILIPPGVLIPSVNFEFFAETDNNSAFAVVCEPGVKATGTYVTYGEASPRLSYDPLNYFQADAAHLELTDVANIDNETGYEINLEFGLTVIGSGQNTRDELSWISIGAEFLNLSRIWVAQVGLYIDQPMVLPPVSSPSITVNDTGIFNKGESGVITLMMNIYELKFTLTVDASINPMGFSTGYHICKFGVRTTGGGYCIENQVPTQTFTVDSGTGRNTAASFDFKELVYGGTDSDLETSLIIMDLFVFLPDDSSVTAGQFYDVEFDVRINGALYEDSKTFSSGGSTTPTETLFPSFDLSFPSTPPVLQYKSNQLLLVETVLSFPVGNYRDVKVRFEVTGQPAVQVPLLDVRVTEVGYNIGCMDHCGSFLPKIDCPPVNDLVTLPQPVNNRGLRCWEGDNDIKLMVYLRVLDILVGATDTLTTTFIVSGSVRATTTFDLNVVDRPSVTPVLPQILHSLDDVSNMEVGGNITKEVEIIFVPNTEFLYDFSVISNVEWMIVNSVTLTYIGEDIVADLTNLAQVDSIIGGEYNATIALGYVNNIALYANETSQERSKIVLQVNFGFRSGHVVNDGEAASMGFRVTASDGAPSPTIDSTETFFLVIAGNGTLTSIESTFDSECPTDTVSPGQVVTCWVTVNFTDLHGSLVFEVDAWLNTTGEAPLLVHSVNVSSIGRNLRWTGLLDVDYTSSVCDCQLNQARVDFGNITNINASVDPMDNYILIGVTLQVTDAAENENGTELVLGVGSSVSDELVWVAYRTFVLERTGAETVQLEYNVTSEESSNTLDYDLSIKHKFGLSSLEVRVLRAILYLPSYLSYISTSTNHSVTVTGSQLLIDLPQLFFSDLIHVGVTLSKSCDYTLSFKEHWKATSILEIQYQTYSRDVDGVVTPPGGLGSTLKDPLIPITTTFNVTRLDTSDGKPPTCFSPVPLGMESGMIADCQITSSQTHNPTDSPYDARRNGVSGWEVGKSGPLAGKRWMKIDIGRLSSLTMIQTQGGTGPSGTGDIGEYEVYYSTDDLVYRRGYHLNDTERSPIFNHRRNYPNPVPADYYDLQTTHFLVHPVEARFVIIRPLNDVDDDMRLYNVLRVELYGCFSEPEQLDKCENRTTPVPYEKLPEEYDRGFAADTDNNTLYVCNVDVNERDDLVKGIKEGTFLFKRGRRTAVTRCFKTADTYTWQSLSRKVRSVIGYSPSTAGVYAIAGSTRPAYVVSYDGGIHWAELTVAEFTATSSSSDYIPGQPLPIESGPGFNHLSPNDLYVAIGDFKATFGGMLGPRGGLDKKILDWNTCCKSGN